MKTILFICTGNVCRSPMAEAMFRHATAGRGDFRVLSAGLGAVDGQPPTAHSVTAMRERGGGHVVVTSSQAGLITTVHAYTTDQFFEASPYLNLLLYPQAVEKTFLLREFDDSLEDFERDISDPIGGSYNVYVHCRNQIEQGVASLLKFMEQHEILSAPQDAKTATTVNFALGADHGGFELSSCPMRSCPIIA